MNKIELGFKISGFVLKQNEIVSDINSDILVFEHEKTGAKLMYIKNDDENKSFAIGFKTPPKDNTGVMHILEHSVLCGSKKYPTKEPFVELCKGSMNTYLNAFTYSDKTVYPIASRNEKDYFNMMEVYLDAVFYPNIYKNEKIFKQEGWHYHIESKDDDIEYKGVVYNEMKGAYSSPLSYIDDLIEKSLFPDNSYKYDAGGFPSDIPNLTYKDFIDTHKKLYHPSNSYIYLYGKLDLEKALTLIDKEYLSNFSKSNINAEIEKQKSFDELRECTYKYSVSNKDKLENQSYIALNAVIDNLDNIELNMALHMLSTLLIDSEEAPLKQAIINAGLGNDVFSFYNDGVLQPYISIILKDSSLDKKNEFKKIVKDTLTDLVKNGINKELIEGCLNVYEFGYRESDFRSIPKGLHYSLDSMGAWIHNADPVERLKFEKYFENIKQALTQPYFENIIEKYILNNTHSSLVVLEPELDLNIKESERIKIKLNDFKQSLTSKELDSLVNETQELLEYQELEDSQEDLSKIPRLSLNDIDKNIDPLNVIEYKVEDIKLLHYDTFTKGIDYVSLMFDTRNIEEKDIYYIGLLLDLLTRVGTDNKDYIEISNDIMKTIGSLNICSTEIGNIHNNSFLPYVEVIMKMMSYNTEKAISLISEVLKDTSFEDEKRIKELINEKISELELTIITSCESIAITKLNSCFNPISKYNEKISGLEYYKFLKELNIDKNFDSIKEKLYSIKSSIFNINNLMVTHIGGRKDLAKLTSHIEKLKMNLNNTPTTINKYSFVEDVTREGLVIPSEVQYVAKGYNYKLLGYNYHGSIEVLKNVLSYGYLWNKIRVQGGAYGAIFNITMTGNISLCSYRDPNIKETLDVYDNMAESIKNIELNDEELVKSIIGTLSNMQLPDSIYRKGRMALLNYMTGKTYSYRQKQLDDILNTKVEDLRNLSSLIRDVMDKDCVVVVGNEKIKNYNKLFDKIHDPLSHR